MRRMTYFVMALALVLGFTQCKKEQPANQTAETVHITLNVENGSKHEIVPDGSIARVNFEKGDVIYVGDGKTYIGTLTCDGTKFSGDISPADGTTNLYFYFVGGFSTTPAELSGKSSFTVDISDQSSKLPVLSFNSATYKGSGDYECTLENQCALVKFSILNGGTDVPVNVGGLYTEAQIDFASNSITNNGTTGFVTLNSTSETEKWAVLLPQTVNNPTVTIPDHKANITTSFPEITENMYYNTGVGIWVF